MFDREMIGEVTANFLFALVVAILLFAGMQSSHSAWQNVAQEWDRYRLTKPQPKCSCVRMASIFRTRSI
jgi:hypothetical protein